MIEAAGVDTWSVCWYVDVASPEQRALATLATVPSKRSMLLDETVEGHRVGWFPDARLVFAEGHPSPDGLAKPASLPDALARLEAGLEARGVIVSRAKAQKVGERRGRGHEGTAIMGPGRAGIRRLDSTVNLRFDSPAEGLAALAGVAAVPVPRVKKKEIREVGGNRLETVYFLGTSGKRVLGRWYDKGNETGEDPRGVLIRPEDQRRFPKSGRLDVEAVATSGFVRESFVRRFEPLWRASKGVKVAGAIELAHRIAELVDEGVMTPGQAKSAAGYLLLETAEVNRQSRAQRYRDRRLCANNGLVLADGVLDEVEVDLEAVIEAALDGEAWGE